MKVFESYLARQIYAGTTLVLIAFLALFAFFEFIEELKDVGRAGYELRHAFLFVLLTLPGRAYELTPVAVLIGTLYALVTLARHSEITVLRTSGMSTGMALRVLAKIGLLFVVLIFLVGEFLAPPAERAGQQIRLKALGKVVGQEFRSGLWVKDEKSFINVRTVLPDTRLQGIRIYEFDDNYVLRAISEAEEGEFDAQGNWRLRQVVQTVFEDNKARVIRAPEVQWESALSPDILNVLMLKPDRMSVVNLYLYIRHLSENGLKTHRYEIAAWKKLIYPLASLVMMALALPFAYLQDRMGAVSAKVFIGIMLGISFHTLNGLFSNLGIINSWPPLFSALTPSLIFLLAAAGMLWWSERR